MGRQLHLSQPAGLSWVKNNSLLFISWLFFFLNLSTLKYTMLCLNVCSEWWNKGLGWCLFLLLLLWLRINWSFGLRTAPFCCTEPYSPTAALCGTRKGEVTFLFAELENVRLAVESVANWPWWKCWSVQSVDGFCPVLVLYVVNHVCVFLRNTTQITCWPSP